MNCDHFFPFPFACFTTFVTFAGLAIFLVLGAFDGKGCLVFLPRTTGAAVYACAAFFAFGTDLVITFLFTAFLTLALVLAGLATGLAFGDFDLETDLDGLGSSILAGVGAGAVAISFLSFLGYSFAGFGLGSTIILTVCFGDLLTDLPFFYLGAGDLDLDWVLETLDWLALVSAAVFRPVALGDLLTDLFFPPFFACTPSSSELAACLAASLSFFPETISFLFFASLTLFTKSSTFSESESSFFPECFLVAFSNSLRALAFAFFSNLTLARFLVTSVFLETLFFSSFIAFSYLLFSSKYYSLS